MSTLLTATALAFELPDGTLLFENLSFSLNTRITALVGPNGVGKSTLAKILAARLEPTSGSIRRHGTVTLFPQRQEPPPVSVGEYLAFDYVWSALGEKLLNGIDREALCTHLSGGQWMRARLVRALNQGFLILDEPSNDLDRDGREALMQFLREHEHGTLLISHDRECLSCCDEILELSNRGLMKFGGGWNAYSEARERERAGLQRELDVATRERDRAYIDRQKKLQQQEKRNRQGRIAGLRGGMPKILLGARKRRAQGTTGKIDTATIAQTQAAVRNAHQALSELKLDPVMYADLINTPLAAQKLVAEAKDWNVYFGHRLYRENLTFSWRGPVRIALKGGNGSGKTTLLKNILGQGAFHTCGHLRSGQLTTLYVDQRCNVLKDELTVFENVREVTAADESEIRSHLARFLFTREDVFKKVRDLSGGERLRTALACGFLSAQRPELLVLDEPTNNLDLANVEFLENFVREFKGALIVISHDEVFLQNCRIEEELRL